MMQKKVKPSSDRLRHDIDQGRAGDKKGFADPSAAPLGTDAEAGGAPPSPEERRIAYEAEVANRPDGPSTTGERRPMPEQDSTGPPEARGDEAPDARSEPDVHGGMASGVIFLGIIAAVLAVVLAVWLI